MNEATANWQPVSSVLQDLPVAYTEIDARGILRVVNEAACSLHEMSAEQLIGHEIWTFLPPDEAARSRTDFFHVIESGEDPPVIRRSLYTASGAYRTHEIHRRMMRDSDGNPIGICCATFDVSEVEAAHYATRQAKLWLESVVDAIPQAVMVTDALGFVRYANPAAEQVIGLPARDLVGQQIEKGMPILRAASASRKPLSFRMALQENWNGDVEILNRERQTVSTWLSACPIVDKETGYTNGVVIVFRSPRIVTPQSGSEPVDASNAGEKAVWSE